MPGKIAEPGGGPALLAFREHRGGGVVKVGVLVVAYNAETTLRRVLDRIPDATQLHLAEVLVHDDHSTDDTTSVARDYEDDNSRFHLTVVRHPKNLGYGGNQKAGYAYAINHGWDVVVLLHGDGQYAPEIMGELIEPIVNGAADAVFGSRMLQRGHARQGGMPMYKYAGNRVLTAAQNFLTGLTLSEWHSGYRAYRVSALAQLPFVGNSDGFDFDTEIILQLADAGMRIDEVPIPTYYGDEICRVNGLQYAKDVIVDTLRYRLGRSGFGSGRLGRVAEPYGFKPSPYSSHGRILQMVHGRKPMRILDVGCGPGWLANALTDAGHTVVGVDVAEGDGVAARMSRFIVSDLADGLPDEVGGDFDLVLAADIIEHLVDPSRILTDMAARVRPQGSIIVSVPNISHWYPRFRIATGRFDYDQRGVLDATHLRFFTRRRFLRVTEEAGLERVAHRHTGLPLDALGLGDSRLVTGTVGRVDRLLVRWWPTMFAYQFVYEFSPWRAGALRPG
ncbi:MAG: glycosyltransferase [Actinobacteria bacterium]|nr:glycosyltransferase [Actinomycetota bacterium]